jgi:hypothetical protein
MSLFLQCQCKNILSSNLHSSSNLWNNLNLLSLAKADILLKIISNSSWIVWTHCWPQGTSVLQWSLQDYLAKVNILGQPTAVTCSYERLAERNSQTHTMHRMQGSNGPEGCLGWLSSNSNNFTTHLLDVQDTATREREMTSQTWTTLKAETRDTRIHRTMWPVDWTLYGGTYHLWVLSTEPGSRHSPGTWNFKLAATFTESLCTPGVASCQKNCCT